MNETLDSVNLIGNDKMRELSAMNRTLYEFLLPEEQTPAEEKILGTWCSKPTCAIPRG